MTIHDDETLQMYLEESLEHLADIENDLLAIEADGADINEDLVNKVYRAAHSIKGGAGFMGLTNIKDLTHEMENILGNIRSREMVPSSGAINALLKAADALKALMEDILNSNDKDISDHLENLRAVLEGHHEDTVDSAPDPDVEETVDDVNETGLEMDEAGSSAEPAPAPETPSIVMDQPGLPTGACCNTTVSLAFPAEEVSLTVADEKIAPHFAQAKCLYLVKLNVQEDILGKNKSCKSVLEEMEQTGVIVSTNFAQPPPAEMDERWQPDVPVMVFLFGSILKPADINILFEIPEAQILEFRTDQRLYVLDGQPADAVKPTVSQSRKSSPKKDASANGLFGSASKPVAAKAKPGPSKKQAAAKPARAKTMQNGKPDQQEATRDPESTKKQTSFAHETSLRVHVSLLDQLMTLAGELVLSRNQLLQSMTSNDQRSSEIAGQRIDLITSELQEAIMLTRMQSIGNVFNKFPRVVRDLAKTLGKEVELTLGGKEVELDKTIIEAIGDPLTHLVRNAVDHGIEAPEVRRQQGKNPQGHIFLKAYHEAGQVNIEITDDGKGLDGNKLANSAIEKGLISEEQAKLLSPRERINLIFLPGFSTAEKVTDVSGRGVGMDVVKTNLDKLGGIIDIDSELGKGTTLKIKLPLTLAIIPCQIVVTGGERYAIPQVNLEELLRIPADQVRDRIERVGNAYVVRLRGNLLPLIRLTDVIGVDSSYIDPATGETLENRRKSLSDRRSKKSALVAADDENREKVSPGQDHREERKTPERRYHASSALNIVVVSTGTMKYGLVVDDLHDSEEIVVKPLGRDLKRCKGYAGATIMGDGRVALILDVSNLAKMAGLASVEGTARAAKVAEAEREAIRARRDRQSLLVFRSSETEQFAVPLNLVERIEKVKQAEIENVGGKRVIKYRGGSLPLFSIDEVAMVQPLADAENLLVIVFAAAGREVGLMAMGPVDALEANLEIDGRTLQQAGIMGSCIINDNTTLIVDIFDIVRTLNPHWFTEPDLEPDDNGSFATILFAEDSTFFRNQVKGSMEKEGFNVLEAEDGVIAWNLLQENAETISLVVTDIEMPNMDGFTLTQKIKQSPIFSHLPVIALTTLAGDEDIAKGKTVGIDDYQIKLDREKLLQSIHSFLKAA